LKEEEGADLPNPIYDTHKQSRGVPKCVEWLCCEDRGGFSTAAPRLCLPPKARDTQRLDLLASPLLQGNLLYLLYTPPRRRQTQNRHPHLAPSSLTTWLASLFSVDSILSRKVTSSCLVWLKARDWCELVGVLARWVGWVRGGRPVGILAFFCLAVTVAICCSRKEKRSHWWSTRGKANSVPTTPPPFFTISFASFNSS